MIRFRKHTAGQTTVHSPPNITHLRTHRLLEHHHSHIRPVIVRLAGIAAREDGRDRQGRAQPGGEARPPPLCSGARVAVLTEEDVAGAVVPAVPGAPAHAADHRAHLAVLEDDPRVPAPGPAEVVCTRGYGLARRGCDIAVVEDKKRDVAGCSTPVGYIGAMRERNFVSGLPTGDIPVLNKCSYL